MSGMDIKSVTNTNYTIPASLNNDSRNAQGLGIYDENIVNSDYSGLKVETSSQSGVSVIAHRGYSAVAPENTIPAFVAAAQSGFEKVECDIEWTKDDVPVILHDDTINRTARHKNGWPILFSKKCSDMNYQDLLKYDFGIWKGKEYKGTKIPTFTEFLKCCSDNGLEPYIELKQTDDFTEEKAQILINAVKEADLEDEVTWIGFNPDYLKMISSIDSKARLGYLSSETPSDATI